MKVYAKETLSLQPRDAWMGLGMLLVVGCPLAIFFLYQGGVKVAPFVWGLLCASSVLGIVLLVFGYRQRFPGGIPYVINITSNSIEFTHRDVANVSDNVKQTA